MKYVMNPELVSLVRFALRALEILEDDRDFTTEASVSICRTAIAEGLLAYGPDSRLVRTPKALNIPPP